MKRPHSDCRHPILGSTFYKKAPPLSHSFRIAVGIRMNFFLLRSTASLVLLSAVLPAMIQAQDATMMDIPMAAIMAGNFGSLVASLSAAGLVEGLSAPNGPFTVLAPTDAAFADLPMGLVDCLLLPDNVETLTSILTYHVLEGSVASGDIQDELEASTLNPEATLLFEVDDEDEILVNDVEIVQTDIATSNGIIHVIEEGTWMVFLLLRLYRARLHTPRSNNFVFLQLSINSPRSRQFRYYRLFDAMPSDDDASRHSNDCDQCGHL